MAKTMLKSEDVLVVQIELGPNFFHCMEGLKLLSVWRIANGG
jgi:hypothetical protein